MGFHTKHCLIICQHVIITVSLISFFSGNYFILFFFYTKAKTNWKPSEIEGVYSTVFWVAWLQTTERFDCKLRSSSLFKDLGLCLGQYLWPTVFGAISTCRVCLHTAQFSALCEWLSIYINLNYMTAFGLLNREWNIDAMGPTALRYGAI